MKYTKEQYSKLKDAISTGVLTVHYGDKTITYRSLSDMLKLLEIMKQELVPERVPRRRRYVEFNRGYFN
jgi:hypothetical protein